MSDSHLCTQQRLKEKCQRRIILILTSFGSLALHGVIIRTIILPWNQSEIVPEVQDPIEIVLIEEPMKTEVVQQPVTEPVAPKAKPIEPSEPVKTEVVQQPVTEPVAPKAKPIEPSEPVKTEVVQQPVTEPVVPKAKPIEPSEPMKTEVVQQPVAEPVVPKSSTSDQRILTNPGPSESIVPEVKTPSLSDSSEKQPQVMSPTSQRGGINCISECSPAYPFALNGVEGSASVELLVGPDGRVISVTLSRAHENSQINRQALLAARKMRFNQSETMVSVQVTVNFTVAGSEFDRIARERQRQQEVEQKPQEQKLPTPPPPTTEAPTKAPETIPRSPIPEDVPLFPDIEERLAK